MIGAIIIIWMFMIGLIIFSCLTFYGFRVLIGLIMPYTDVPEFTFEEIFRLLDF